MKKIATMVLAGTMALAMLPGTALAEGLEPVKFTEQMIEDNVKITPDNGIQMIYQGYFEEEIAVGEDTVRSAKVYIPEGTNQGEYFVAIAVPDGMNTEEFLTDSGWISEADEKGFCLFAMEPVDQTWGTPDEEAAYIQAAYQTMVGGKYYLPFASFYLAGYGVGGTALQKYAMTNAITVASAVFVDASDIDEAYLTDLAGQNYNRAEVNMAEVPVPVWLIGEGAADSAVTAYWKKANEAEEEGTEYALGSTCYAQKAGTENPFTYCGNVATTIVLDGEVDIMDPAVTEAFYDFLSKTTRYGGNAGGNVVAERPDYEALGVEIKELECEGYPRMYMVYIPEALRGSEEALPMVISLHGGNQTAPMMFDTSHWYEIADENGFILVHPTSTVNPGTTGKVATPSWNSARTEGRADDIVFLKALIAQLEEDYNVDTSRIYLGGQSNGCMMTQYAGMVMAEYFAALGSTSGPVSSIPEVTGDEVIPYYFGMGQYDFWNYDLHEDPVKQTVEYWLNRNGLSSLDEPTEVETRGRYNISTWKNEAGIPLYVYMKTEGRGHSFVPEEMYMLWDWYSHWTLDPEQGRLYDGTPIE